MQRRSWAVRTGGSARLSNLPQFSQLVPEGQDGSEPEWPRAHTPHAPRPLPSAQDTSGLKGQVGEAPHCPPLSGPFCACEAEPRRRCSPWPRESSKQWAHCWLSPTVHLQQGQLQPGPDKKGHSRLCLCQNCSIHSTRNSPGIALQKPHFWDKRGHLCPETSRAVF